MNPVSLGATSVPSSFAAGLVLVGFALLDSVGVRHAGAVEAVAALGASRTRAYAAKQRLEHELPALVRRPGRPPSELEQAPPADTDRISLQVLDFLMRHPGCVHRGETRTRYSDGFRSFVLELCEHHRDVPLHTLATASRVPLGTVKDWLAGGDAEVDLAEKRNLAEVSDPLTEPRIAAILAAYHAWEGDLLTFCTHVQRDLRIPFGRDLIRSILEAEGVRIPRRRRGRGSEAEASRGSFETFFPHAQWIGDGKELVVEVADERFAVHLELMVDAASGAAVGGTVRDEEDAAAVVEAFHDGVDATDATPLAVLLDNKPSNHAPDVVLALGEVMKIRATPYRAENKAHVEGSFGLLSQVIPELRISSLEPQVIAREVAQLVAITWGRTLNHRPRADRGGKTRAQLLEERPTDEQREAARRALAERLRVQDEARRTRRARLDPVVRQLLDDAFDRLDLTDPERHLRDAIARHPLDAVVNGIAVFEGKRRAGTLPDGVDARYLLGIVRRIGAEQEGRAIAEALFEWRVRLQDRALRHLQARKEALVDETQDVLGWLRALIDQITSATRSLDRYFWLRTAADLIEEQAPEEHRRLFLIAARRIHAVHGIPKRDRNALVRRLATMLRPVA